MQTYINLKPIVESTADYEAIEKRIRSVFKELLYAPLLRALKLSSRSIQNASKSPLIAAIESGKVWGEVEDGLVFYGEFNAAISKELKRLGAKWSRWDKRWELFSTKVTPELHAEVQAATSRSVQAFLKAADTLSQNLPAEIAGAVRVVDFFDAALLKVDKAFKGTVKDVAIAPELTPKQRRQIAEEWQENMERWVKDFADEEVETLRENIKRSAFRGTRYESSVATIRHSFGVTERKAKFLARQETGLLMAKFKESRYTESGIHEYTWRCVSGSASHPVRPSHKVLDGKVFRFDTPPITTPPSEPARRNNPGEDYNCRCHAIPRVKV